MVFSHSGQSAIEIHNAIVRILILSQKQRCGCYLFGLSEAPEWNLRGEGVMVEPCTCTVNE